MGRRHVGEHDRRQLRGRAPTPTPYTARPGISHSGSRAADGDGDADQADRLEHEADQHGGPARRDALRAPARAGSARNAPIETGSSTRPAWIADSPSPACSSSGSRNSRPNSPTPTISSAMLPSVNERTRIRAGSRITGSARRIFARCTNANAANSAAAGTSASSAPCTSAYVSVGDGGADQDGAEHVGAARHGVARRRPGSSLIDAGERDRPEREVDPERPAPVHGLGERRRRAAARSLPTPRTSSRRGRTPSRAPDRSRWR